MSVLVCLLIFVLLLLVFMFLFKAFIKILVYRMADKRILFVTVREGEAVAIMVGKKLDRIIMNLKGYHFDKEYNVLPGEDTKQDFITKLFPGVYWLGLPGVNEVYEYSFAWTKPDDITGEPKSRVEAIEQIYVKTYQYLFHLKDSETFSMVPVSIPFLVKIKVVNPYTALFRNEKWLNLVNSAVLDRARSFLATFDDPDELMELSKGDAIQDEKLKAKLPKENGDIITSFGKIVFHLMQKDGMIGTRDRNGNPLTKGSLEEGVGAEILQIDVPSIDFGEYAETAKAEIIAQKKGEAAFEEAKWLKQVMITESEGKSTALLIKTEAELYSYRALQMTLGSDFVIALRLLEAYANTAKAGTNFVLDGGTINNLMGKLGKSEILDADIGDMEKKLAEIATKKGFNPEEVLEKIKRIAEQGEITRIEKTAK